MKSEKEIKKRLESRRKDYLKYKDTLNGIYLDGYTTALEWVLSNERIEE